MMNRRAKNRLLFMGASLAFSSIFQMGYSNAYPNTAIDGFRQFLNSSSATHGKIMDEERFNWVWSAILNVWFIGFALGSWIAVPIADRIGRKWCLVVGNSANFVSACLATLSILLSLPSLYFCSRILFAVSAAVSMNSLILLLQESSPPSMRGLMSFNAEMAFVVMNLVGALAGMRFVLGKHLEWLVGFSCLPTLCSVLIALPFHESPKYLSLKKKDKVAAEESIQFYQKTDQHETSEVLLSFEAERVEGKSGIREAFSSHHTLFGLALGVVTLQLTSSIWPVLYFSTEFLIRAGISAENAELVSTLMLFLSSLSTVLGMFLVEKYPRRLILLSSASLNVSALLLFVVCEQSITFIPDMRYGCVIAVVLHGTSYSVGLGPIAWFLTAELVPLNHRALCQSLALSINQLTALVLCFVTLPLYNKIGSMVILYIFVIPGCICIFILSIYLPETRSKTLDDVTKQMSEKCSFLKRATSPENYELKKKSGDAPE